MRTLKLEFVALNELEERPDPLGVFRLVEKRRYILGRAIEIQLPRAPGQAVLQVRGAFDLVASRWGFLAAANGMAVETGNIWRFLLTRPLINVP